MLFLRMRIFLPFSPPSDTHKKRKNKNLTVNKTLHCCRPYCCFVPQSRATTAGAQLHLTVQGDDVHHRLMLVADADMVVETVTETAAASEGAAASADVSATTRRCRRPPDNNRDDEYGDDENGNENNDDDDDPGLWHFVSAFVSSRAGLPALTISVLLSFGSVVTVGMVPEVLSDRYARLYHGYGDDEMACSDYNADRNLTPPQACLDGADDAQAGSAWGSVASNLLTLLFGPTIGRYSDVSGRRVPLVMATFLFLLAPVALLVLQRVPSVDPCWYYAADSCTGFISFLGMMFASMSDCIMPTTQRPDAFRAGSFAAILGAFYFGYAVAPSLELFMTHQATSVLSCILCATAFLYALVGFPETLLVVVVPPSPTQTPAPAPSGSSESAVSHPLRRRHCRRRRRRAHLLHPLPAATPPAVCNDDEEEDGEDDDDDDDNMAPNEDALSVQVRDNDDAENNKRGCCDNSFCSHCLRAGVAGGAAAAAVFHPLLNLVLRPFRGMSILNRTPVMRLVAVGSFLSAAVFATDRTLVVFYIEEHLDVRESDIAKMFFLLGLLGVLAQCVGLQPLVRQFGQRGLLVLTFLSGTVHNACYGLAHTKATIYVALGLSQLTKLNFPVLSAVAAGQVSPLEQGHVQGALFALNALAGAFGPLCMDGVYEKTKDGVHPPWWGPGTMFLLASCLYLLGTVAVYMIPTTIDAGTGTRRTPTGEGGDGGDDEEIDVGGLALSGPEGLEEPLLAAHHNRQENEAENTSAL